MNALGPTLLFIAFFASNLAASTPGDDLRDEEIRIITFTQAHPILCTAGATAILTAIIYAIQPKNPRLFIGVTLVSAVGAAAVIDLSHPESSYLIALWDQLVHTDVSTGLPAASSSSTEYPVGGYAKTCT